MNNKKIGSNFEKEFCELLSKKGYWVHFLQPAANGSQPFDIIAIASGIVKCIDCKTVDGDRFPLSRVEDNQYLAYLKLSESLSGHSMFFALKHGDSIILVPAGILMEARKSGVKSISIKYLEEQFETYNLK